MTYHIRLIRQITSRIKVAEEKLQLLRSILYYTDSSIVRTRISDLEKDIREFRETRWKLITFQVIQVS